MLTVVVGERVWKRDVGGSVKGWLLAQGMTGVNTRRQPAEFESEAFKNPCGSGVAMDSDGHLLAYGYHYMYNKTSTAFAYFCIALADVNEEAVRQGRNYSEWLIANWSAPNIVCKLKRRPPLINEHIWFAVENLLEYPGNIERVLGVHKANIGSGLIGQFGLGHCTALAISPDSESLFCAFTDGTTREICTETGDIKHIYHTCNIIEHLDWVLSAVPGSSIAVSLDGHWLCINTSSESHEWNVTTGLSKNAHFDSYPQASEASIEYDWNNGGLRTEVSDGRLVLRCTTNGCEIWDHHINECIQEIRHGDLAGFSPDGTKVITRNKEGSDVRIWDVQSGKMKCRVSFGGYAGAAFSSDGKLIIARSLDSGNYELWSATTGELLHTLEAKSSSSINRELCRDVTFSFSFSEDCSRVLTHESKYARLWDTASGRCLHSFRCGRQPAFPRDREPALSPDGKRVLTYSKHKSYIRDAGTGRMLAKYDHIVEISPDWSAIQYRSKGNRISATLSNEILFSAYEPWDFVTEGYIPISTLQMLMKHDFYWKYCDRCLFSPGFTRIAIRIDYDGPEWYIGDVNYPDHGRHGKFCSFGGAFAQDYYREGGNMIMDFSADSSKAIVANLMEYDSDLDRHDYYVSILFFMSPESIQYYDLRKTDFEGQKISLMSAVAMSPGGNFCATASYDCKVILWNANTGNSIRFLLPTRSLLPNRENDWHVDICRRNFMIGSGVEGVFIRFLSFSNDETRLLATFSDGTCYLWEIGAHRSPDYGFWSKVESCIDSL